MKLLALLPLLFLSACERPPIRRLPPAAKMQDRVYRIESNRSQEGVEVTGALP